MDGITTSINAILKNLIKNFNTLLDCPVRFSGEYSKQKVHSFIEYIEYYKRIKCIEDNQALQELQYLLLDQANDWWLRRKANLDTWSEALTLLENHYSKKRPSHIVFKEILKHHYEDYECEDDFIDDKIELFDEFNESQLKLKENNKLEIIYALLPNDIQEKVKLVNVTSIKELKDQLKLAKQDNSKRTSNNANTTVNIENTTENELVSSKDKSTNFSELIVSSEMDNHVDSDKDPVIKVRRTEDLMPQDIKEEDESEMLQEESLLCATNNILLSNHDNFQIDTDIMKQINSIIDESEMNLDATNENEVTPPALKQSSNDRATKKGKKRCSYCRRCNHTVQMCLKKAKHMKLFPERFLKEKGIDNSIILQETQNDEQSAPLPNSNLMTTSLQPSESLPTTFLNQNSTDTSSAVAHSSAALNVNSEKSINSILTTKLIAPINGKTSNKILAAKLRNINTPSPKCHQCGTLGFYKSICPNCSPIYNNNNHNQYGK